MLLSVVQPMTSSSRTNNTLQLVRFHPDDLLALLVAPEPQAFSAEFHGSENVQLYLKCLSAPTDQSPNKWLLPACDPQKDQSFILQALHVQRSHFIIAHCSVWQLHVDIPGWIGHDNGKLAQYGQIEETKIALDPLKSK